MVLLTEFPIGIHILTIPLVLGLGFLFGWLARSAATPTKKPRRPDPEDGGATGDS